MKKILTLTLLTVLFLSTHSLFAQLKDDKIKMDYDRNSITILHADYTSENLPMDFTSASVPKLGIKYNDNSLNYSRIFIADERPTFRSKIDDAQTIHDLFEKKDDGKGNLEEQKVNLISNALIKKQTAADIMDIWCQKDAGGNPITVNQRSAYNLPASAIRGDIDPRKKASIQPLFEKNVVIVLDYHDAGTIAEIEAVKQVSQSNIVKKLTKNVEEKKPKDGVQASYTAYYFLVDMGDDLFNHVTNNFNNPEKRRELDYTYSLLGKSSGKLIRTRSEHSVEAGTAKSDAELYQYITNSTHAKVMEYYVQNIRIGGNKSQIKSISPVRAEIGLREGILPDHRYFVYTNVAKKSGELFSKRVGVVRATTTIADNREVQKDEDGNFRTTTFRQISGGKLYEGLILREARDKGVSVATGITSRDARMVSSTIISQNVGSLLGRAFKGVYVSELRFFFQFDLDRMPGEGTRVGVPRVGLGMSKTVLYNKFINVVPYLGYYSQNINEDDKNGYLRVGVRLPITILHNLYLEPEAALTTQGNGKGQSNTPLSIRLRADF